MTTPARNIRQALIHTGTRCQQDIAPIPRPNVCAPSSACAYKWVRDVRPASGNGGRIGGFRLCRGFSHSGGTMEYSGDASYTVKQGVSITKKTFSGACFWVSGITPPDPTLPSSNMENACLVKALNRVKSQDVHLGNFFAEGQKTVDMVGLRARQIGDQVFNWRRRNPASQWELVRQWQRGNLPRYLWCKIPSSWLELQYGWIPLMSDLYGGLNHLYRRSRFQIPYVTGKAQQGGEDILTQNCNAVEDGFSTVLKFRQQQVVRIGLFYQISNPVLAELSSLGLINPLEIVWELTRYSFVVDWFIPIGSWLSALTADAGMTFISGYKSSSSEMRFDGATPVSIPNGTSIVEGTVSPPSLGGKMKAFVRTCYASSPVPGLYVKSPVSLLHATNAIALLAQRFR